MSTGKVEFISVRPAKRSPVQALDSVLATEASGLAGDHYAGKSGNRQVTLIQAEHLPVIAGLLKKENTDPALTRRNIVVSGINLLSFAGKPFKIGEAVLQMTGSCEPCERMDENFGDGGRAAMEGHGGITARVLRGGVIKVGDPVSLTTEQKP